MRKKLLAFGLPLALVAAAVALSVQPSAVLGDPVVPTTVDGCRAALQTAKAEVPLEIGQRTLYLRSLRIEAVAEKSLAMASCGNIDEERSSYYTLFSNIYDAEQMQRYEHFVDRHHLTDKLLREDAAGER